jgi:hypothetical protein
MLLFILLKRPPFFAGDGSGDCSTTGFADMPVTPEIDDLSS